MVARRADFEGASFRGSIVTAVVFREVKIRIVVSRDMTRQPWWCDEESVVNKWGHRGSPWVVRAHTPPRPVARVSRRGCASWPRGGVAGGRSLARSRRTQREGTRSEPGLDERAVAAAAWRTHAPHARAATAPRGRAHRHTHTCTHHRGGAARSDTAIHARTHTPPPRRRPIGALSPPSLGDGWWWGSEWLLITRHHASVVPRSTGSLFATTIRRMATRATVDTVGGAIGRRHSRRDRVPSPHAGRSLSTRPRHVRQPLIEPHA